MPRSHGQWTDDQFQAAQSQPGTAENLSTLFTGPGHSCPPHRKIQIQGRPKKTRILQKYGRLHLILELGATAATAVVRMDAVMTDAAMIAAVMTGVAAMVVAMILAALATMTVAVL
jgi:hypothetical protein